MKTRYFIIIIIGLIVAAFLAGYIGGRRDSSHNTPKSVNENKFDFSRTSYKTNLFEGYIKVYEDSCLYICWIPHSSFQVFTHNSKYIGEDTGNIWNFSKIHGANGKQGERIMIKEDEYDFDYLKRVLCNNEDPEILFKYPTKE